MNKFFEIINIENNVTRYIIIAIGVLLILTLIGYIFSNIEVKRRLNKD